MAFAYPGNQNVVVPTLELSNNLLIEFGRNVKDFTVNKVAKQVPVKAPIGLYLYFNPLDLARIDGVITAGVAQQFRWAQGNLRPVNNQASVGFEHRPFQTERRSYENQLDLQVAQLSNAWDVQKTTTQYLAQLAMTDRAMEVAVVMTTAANYPASHVDTAANWSGPGGNFLSLGTEVNPLIKKALVKLAIKILLDSAGNVRRGQLVVVMNPNTAATIAVAQEIQSIFSRSQFARELLTTPGIDSNANLFGLPDTLYGFPVYIEDATANFNNRGNASEAQTFVFPDNVIAMVTLEGRGIGTEGGHSYSTVTLFVYEKDDMKVDARTDDWNRLIQMAVTDNRQVLTTAGVTGGLITNVYA